MGIRYRRKDDVIINFNHNFYQFRFRPNGNDFIGEAFYFRNSVWKNKGYTIRIEDNQIYGLPNSSYIESYAIQAFNKEFPNRKIRSRYWDYDGKPSE